MPIKLNLIIIVLNVYVFPENFTATTETTESSLKRNLKYFWNFVKKNRNDTSIPSSMPLGDEEASDGGCIYQLFSTHFKSVYRPSVCNSLVHNDSPDFVYNRQITATIIDFCITINLKENNHADLDGIPFISVKKFSASLSEPLLFFFFF